MRSKISSSKNSKSYSILYDVTINGKRTTKIYEPIGNLDDIKIRANGKNPLIWFNYYVDSLNKKCKANSLPVIITKNPNKLIEKDN